MVVDAIKDVSGRGEIVLDSFSGSGTIMIAAHESGRRARVMELDPIYVDHAIRRWQQFARDEAVHADTGLSFGAMADAGPRKTRHKRRRDVRKMQ